MGSDYDADTDSKYLMYLDVNNLYGWAMQHSLPYGGFQWIEDIDHINLSVPDDAPIGYILGVDLEYSENLHDVHKDSVPFGAVHKKPPGSSQVKLLTTVEQNSDMYFIIVT